MSFAWMCPVTGRCVVGTIAPEGVSAVECAADTDPSLHYVKAEALLVLPPRPGAWAVWEAQAEAWTDPRSPAEIAADLDRQWAALRAERNRRLTACDWTQVADAPVDQTAWAAYRAALRALPENTPDPLHPVWPQPPANT